MSFELSLPIGTPPRVGTFGEPFIVDVGLDVSLATARTLRFRNPSGAIVNQAAVAGATDTKIQFTPTTATFWNQTGIWSVQAIVDLPGPKTLKTSVGNFFVS